MPRTTRLNPGTKSLLELKNLPQLISSEKDTKIQTKLASKAFGPVNAKLTQKKLQDLTSSSFLQMFTHMSQRQTLSLEEIKSLKKTMERHQPFSELITKLLH